MTTSMEVDKKPNKPTKPRFEVKKVNFSIN